MIENKRKIIEFQQKILSWYYVHGRNFYWRNSNATKYERIISEVLLQRTKVQTVAKFLPKFLEVFPSWEILAEATEKELQEFLKPLGLYKQRGSRLFKLAKEISLMNGKFPESRSKVEELPMMGQYLTNAYELFILNQPSPLLDVNMARVLERFFKPRKLTDIRYDPFLQNLAWKVVDHKESKEINWGILDLGGIICVNRKPKCIQCPLQTSCNYFNSKI